MNTHPTDLAAKADDLRARIEDLNRMVLEGRLLDAHENQVAVQQWRDGLIVHERFYYGA